MKKTQRSMKSAWRALTVALAASALVTPAVRAQTAEELKQLKTQLEQMQKTIDAQNARIADLEKAKGTQPAATTAAPAAAATAASPSVRTVEKVAAGEQIGQQSPVKFRDALNDQQEAATRPKDFTIDPQYRGFIPIPNTPALI